MRFLNILFFIIIPLQVIAQRDMLVEDEDDWSVVVYERPYELKKLIEKRAPKISKLFFAKTSLPDSLIVQLKKITEIREARLSISNLKRILDLGEGQNFHSLKVINEQVETIDARIFNLERLTKLELSSLDLSELGNIPENHSLESLDLSKNLFSILPKSLERLKRLSHLDISKNAFLDFPYGVKLPTVKHLSISPKVSFDSNIELPKSINSDFPALEFLSIVDYDTVTIKSFPENIEKMEVKANHIIIQTGDQPGLPSNGTLTFGGKMLNYQEGKLPDVSKLNLLKLQFEEIPVFLKESSNLQELIINGSKLGFAKFENLPVGLKKLFIIYGTLTGVHESINQLTQLQELYFYINSLEKIPQIQLPNLQILDLSKNKISHLSEVLPNVKVLNLANNKIAEIAQTIVVPPQLEQLLLQNNDLSEIPESICNGNSLQVLNLSGNQLTELPDYISSCRNLRSLGLEKNNLSKVPESVCKCTKLEFLNIKNNNISDLPECILKMENLETVVLGSNPISPERIKELNESSSITFY